MLTTDLILVAEDDEDDFFFFTRAYRKADLTQHLIHAQDGREVRASLQSEPSRYCLVFLDIKMPGEDGFSTLKWLKSRPELSHLPVVMLTSSNDAGDRQRAKDLGANDYLMKPNSVMELAKLLAKTREKWIKPQSASVDIGPNNL